MEETLIIGVVSKPQGVKGELKINPITSDVNRFNNLKSVIIDGKTYRVENSKSCGNFAVISLETVYDRNTAETFRGKFLRVERKDAIPLNENEYYIADMVGSALCTEKGEIGKITQVTSGKTDVFTVLCNGGDIMRFPFLKDLLIGVDVKNGKVTVKGKRLSEVAVYED